MPNIQHETPDPPNDTYAIAAPTSSMQPTATVLGCRAIVDEFAWMQTVSPGVLQHLQGENTYANSLLDTMRPIYETILGDIEARAPHNDASTPVRIGDFDYFSVLQGGSDFLVFCRVRADSDRVEVVVDVRALAQETGYADVQSIEVSDDQHFVAFIVDTSGDRHFTGRVRDLRSGEYVPLAIPGATSIAWAATGDLIATVEGEARRPDTCVKVPLDGGAHVLLYHEHDPGLYLGVHRSRSRTLLMLVGASHSRTAWWVWQASHPEGPPRLVCEPIDGRREIVQHCGDLLYVLTDEAECNNRLVTMALAAVPGSPRHDLIPCSPTTTIESFDVFEKFIAVVKRERGRSSLVIVDRDGVGSREVEFDEPIFELQADENPDMNTKLFRFRYDSLTTPTRTLELDIEMGTISIVHEEQIGVPVDRSQYVVERATVTARDGIDIPVSLVWRRDLDITTPHPLMLAAYGCYGISCSVAFSVPRLSIIDRGAVFAIAHVRGGGELGRQWHESGRRSHKVNGIHDFVDVAEDLCSRGLTSPGRIVSHSSSAGAIVVAGAANERPDLFAALVMDVPFIDILTALADEGQPLSIIDHEEFGDPRESDDMTWLYEVCPYLNVPTGQFPAVYAQVGLEDPLAPFWGAAKYVARVRARSSGQNPAVLRVAMVGGHEGPTDRRRMLQKEAEEYTWIAAHLFTGDAQ